MEAEKSPGKGSTGKAALGLQSTALKLLTNGKTLNVIASDGSLNVVYDNFGHSLTEGNEVYYRATVNGSQTSEYKVPYYNQVRNEGFEQPVIDNVDNKYSFKCRNSYFIQVPNGYDGLVWKTTVKENLHDYTTQDYFIEIVDGNSSKSAYGISGAADGNQFAELNCEAIGALYQDVLTTPGADLYWQLSHRARYGGADTNTMYVVVMSASLAESGGTDGGPIDSMEEVDAAINNNTPGVKRWEITSNGLAWNSYTNSSFNGQSDPYEVPEGQYLTRFFFVSANEGNRTEGNLLDKISFNESLPGKGNVVVTKKVEGLTSEELGDDYTVEVSLSQNGAAVSTKTITVDSAAMEGSATFANLAPGTYTVSETITNQKSGYEFTSEYSSDTVTVVMDTTQYVTITNKYEKTSQNLTVKKVWSVPEGSNVEIPGEIKKKKLQLYKNGVPEGAAVTLTSANANANGEEIIYNVAENPVDGYQLTYEASNGKVTLTNTYVKTLRIEKTAVGFNSTDEFKFAVTAVDSQGKTIGFPYEKGIIGESAALGDYSDSLLEITLSNNECVEIKLPIGATYTVTETSVEGVKTYVDGELKNSTSGAMTNGDTTIRFLNWKP